MKDNIITLDKMNRGVDLDNFVLENLRLRVGARLLYALLVRYEGTKITKKQLSELLACSLKTVYNWTKDLEKEGLVVKNNGRYKVFAYETKPDLYAGLPARWEDIK